MTTTEITNTQDYIDSRDIAERIDYLESLEEDIDEIDKVELELLKSLEEEAATSEWSFGVTLIRESYFEEYAEELASDIGAISSDDTWPLNHINWEAAANELLIDYSQIDFDGVTYYFR